MIIERRSPGQQTGWFHGRFKRKIVIPALLKVLALTTPTSKLTSKYQATIPEPVRRLLQLNAGDTLAFDIEEGVVRLRKAQPLDMAFTEGVEESLGEWLSDEDESAYGGL